MKNWPSKEVGLTLLEVLIALVILAFALTAIIKTTAENIRSTAYLQEKTVATWVGLNSLNKAELGLLYFPEEPEHRVTEEIMLNQHWQWQGFSRASANPEIRELHVSVFHEPEHRFVTELTGYIYAN